MYSELVILMRRIVEWFEPPLGKGLGFYLIYISLHNLVQERSLSDQDL